MSTITTKDGRVFELVGERPYTTKDRRKIKLAVWRGACAECGAPFEVATRMHFDPERTPAFERKRCNEHKLTLAQVHENWWRAVQKGLAKRRRNA